MIDLVLSIGLSIAGACLIALCVRYLVREPVAFPAFIGAMLALLFYWAAIVAGAELQGSLPGVSSLKWNWLGKVVTTVAVLAAIAAIPSVDRNDVGLRLRLNPGSAGPALVCLMLICAISWSIEFWASDGRDLSVERLAFQALMPGLDEELFFRGLLLAFLLRAFDERWTLFGTPVGPVAIIVTFIFAAGHGLAIVNGQLLFDAQTSLLSGALGFGLLWIRQRTGSVLPAIVAHNLINVGNSFF